MSIKINNKTIAGRSIATSYRYVGEIFQSALPINDSKVALLDGRIINQDQGYGSFIQYISSLSAIYPQIACTEEEWQAQDTKYGECGKFVINGDKVRLPRIVSFIQGLNSLQDLAVIVEAGLPTHTHTRGTMNITGTWSPAGLDVGYLATPTGAFGNNTRGSNSYLAHGAKGGNTPYINFNASNAWTGETSEPTNPIYGNSDTVQPQAIRYPYYIVLATGVSQTINVKEDITLNNPYSLGDSKYSPIEIENTSWLKSEGQWNTKEMYPSYYDWIVKNINKGTKGFVISAEDYTDYDFVLDIDNESFRLPLLDGSESVPDNSNVTIICDDVTSFEYTVQQDGIIRHRQRWTTDASGSQTVLLSLNGFVYPLSSNYAECTLYNIQVKKGDVVSFTSNSATLTVLQYFVPYRGNGSLYYYIGETLQNAYIANIGAITNTLTKKLDRQGNATVIESYNNATSWYRIWSDGWCEQGGQTSGNFVVVTLLKPYINTNYSLEVTPLTDNDASASNWHIGHFCGVRVSNSQIKIGYSGSWVTKGYIA